jgi:hypothetical protein
MTAPQILELGANMRRPFRTARKSPSAFRRPWRAPLPHHQGESQSISFPNPNAPTGPDWPASGTGSVRPAAPQLPPGSAPHGLLGLCYFG